MTEERQLERLEEACAEHDRLALALASAREEQERVLKELLDALAPRLHAAARDLRFAAFGARARGVALEQAFFLVVDDERAWSILARHAHGIHAVVKRASAGALLDTFGRGAGRMMLDALIAAEATAAARVTPPPAVADVTRLPSSAVAAPPRPRAKPSHQVCRLCGARLPAGRLDPHLTAMHGIFHVHPHGDREESRRESARRSMRPRADAKPLPTSRPVASGRPARDFLAEARHERTLVARADSPHHDRDREGRFSDAPDVERMDDDSRG